MHFNLLFTITISALILVYANGIRASKRIKRQTELKMANTIDSDFAVLKPQKREEHELNERNAEKNDGSNQQQSKENETKMMKRPPIPAVIVQEKVPITITHAARVVKLPKKLVLRNPSHHNPQMVQHLSQINDDPILDYLFNTLGGVKPMYPNVQSIGPLKAQYDVPRTRTIIYAPPVVLKQPVQQHNKQMESLMENALTSLLLDDSNPLAAGDDNVCSPHSKSGNVNSRGNVNAAIAGDANINDNKSDMSNNNDDNVIQFCSCHFIKRLKEKH